jgi:response regulator RpfG family c-di-GMP phosphodiesterase
MMGPFRVVVVDDTSEVRSVLKDILDATPEFEFAGSASTGKDGVDLVLATRPDLVLMDIEMPGHSGLDAARSIVDLAPLSKVIAWTNHEDPTSITEMIAAGAIGYLLKGASPDELVEHLKWAAEGQPVLSRSLTSAVLSELSRLYRASEQRAEELHTSYLSTVDSLAAALETKDDQTGNHARRVRDYAAILSESIDRRLLEREALVFGFLLHDVGKIGIPEQILMKPGPLDDEEWAVMRRHPEMGARILESIKFLQGDALEIVISHHERWDGRGYPAGMAKEEIPVGARIFAVVDAFDAMTTDRPYRKALSMGAAFDEIVRCSGEQFDPDVVDAFLDIRSEIMARMATDLSPRAEAGPLQTDGA